MAYPKPNQHGVYLPEVCEVLTLPGVGATRRARVRDLAHVMIVQVGSAAWLAASDHQCNHGHCCGHGGYPRVRGTRYRSRQEAIASEARVLRAIARSLLADRARDVKAAPSQPDWWTPSVPAAQEREARALETWALQLLGGVEGQMQMDLLAVAP